MSANRKLIGMGTKGTTYACVCLRQPFQIEAWMICDVGPKHETKLIKIWVQ
jgi:hypothetical protein